MTLRPASDWTRLGKPYQRLDIVAKSTGTQDYGIDVVLPGMLHATVRANPGRGGGMASYSADAALAMQGVRSVVEVNEGLAVIADNTWFAFQAAEALEVDWLPPDYPASSAEMWQALADARTDEFRNSRLRDDGDVEAALDGATVIEAEYRTPFLAHAALEPLSATVLVEADRVHDLDRDADPRRGARRGGRDDRPRSVAGHPPCPARRRQLRPQARPRLRRAGDPDRRLHARHADQDHLEPGGGHDP